MAEKFLKHFFKI